jgi:hypothetical protein
VAGGVVEGVGGVGVGHCCVALVGWVGC